MPDWDFCSGIKWGNVYEWVLDLPGGDAMDKMNMCRSSFDNDEDRYLVRASFEGV